MPLKGINSDNIKNIEIAKDQIRYRSSAFFLKICDLELSKYYRSINVIEFLKQYLSKC